MSSRENILRSISEHRPQEFVLPDMIYPLSTGENTVEQFMRVLNGIGGSCTLIHHLYEITIDGKSNDHEIVNGIDGMPGCNGLRYRNMNAAELDVMDTVLLQGMLAVAENGAIWLPEKNMVNRLLPFICQHLVLVIEERNIVPSMQHVYDAIKINEDGYGVFIAGPSKTADIEQSLVVGAHGPLSLHVFILKSM